MADKNSNVAKELEPVVLELGKALFICQCFEGTLMLLLATISYEEADMEEGAFIAAMELFSKKTLGHLLHRIREKVEAPTEMNDCFTEGWDNRNWIVHHFLHSTVHELSSPKGRLETTARLVAAKQAVKRADMMANRVFDLYLAKYGTSVATLKVAADRLWDQLNPQRTEKSQ